MAKADIALLAGLAGFFLGAAGVYVATTSRSVIVDVEKVQASDNDVLAALGEKLKSVDGAVTDLTRRVNTLDRDPKQAESRLADLEARIAKLETSSGGRESGAGAAVPGNGSSTASLSDAEIEALRKKVFADEATQEEQQKFWQVLRERPEYLANAMKQLEKAVADNPRDVDSRMKLAETYIAKLLSVPSGPEQGVWSLKSIDQYKKILELDANHWDARYSLAFNYSQWPDFLNKTADAIKEFETLRKVQEQQTPEAKHAQTYLQLSKLYVKTGKTDAAKQALEDGLRRHPDDAELKKALDAAK